jgi:hypothetical protein
MNADGGTTAKIGGLTTDCPDDTDLGNQQDAAFNPRIARITRKRRGNLTAMNAENTEILP